MVVRKTQDQKDIFYFCTFTCLDWLPLIKVTNTYDAIYKWFDWMNDHDNPIIGYVVMPNHLHVIFYLNPNSTTVNKIISNAKRILAYEIVKRLKASFNNKILEHLKSAVKEEERNRGKIHRVFNPSFDAKAIEDPDTLSEKLNYMHNNPVSGKWQLVYDFIDFKYSSAKYYETGVHSNYEVVDYRDIEFYR